MQQTTGEIELSSCGSQLAAREVCDYLCYVWGLADPENYSLCEVTVVHGGLVKQVHPGRRC